MLSARATAATALLALICALAVASADAQNVSTTTFYPYPGVTHADHDDDHRGYWLTMRNHDLVSGVSVATATQALTTYLYQLTARDDVIVFGAFYDTASGTYVTSTLWRTEAGAAASVSYALSHGGNYRPFLAQREYFAGTVRNFFENEEVHSAVELGLYRQLRISGLAQPRVYNASNIPAIVEQRVLPVAQTLPGSIDYTTAYPTVPLSNVFWMTEKTYSNRSSFSRDSNQLEPTIQQYMGDALGEDLVFEGQISVFWHSAPGLTDALPAGVSAPAMPLAPGTTMCSAAAPAATASVTGLLLLIAARALASQAL